SPTGTSGGPPSPGLERAHDGAGDGLGTRARLLVRRLARPHVHGDVDVEVHGVGEPHRHRAETHPTPVLGNRVERGIAVDVRQYVQVSVVLLAFVDALETLAGIEGHHQVHLRGAVVVLPLAVA